MPLRDLRQLHDYIGSLLTKLDQGPRREIDIATEHPEDPSRVRVLRINGDPKSSRWMQVERIYCSPPCADCPHGDYFYRYTRRKNGSVRVQFKSKAFFPHETLEHLKEGVRPSMASLEICRDKDTNEE
jgi:hypothetical protein